MVEVSNIRRLPNGGYYADFIYKMAGLKFEGYGEDVEIIPNRWMVTDTHGGIDSRITWTFRARGQETRVTLTIEYTVPIPLLGRLAEAIIVMMNDQEADLIMANLKARFMTPGK